MSLGISEFNEIALIAPTTVASLLTGTWEKRTDTAVVGLLRMEVELVSLV